MTTLYIFPKDPLFFRDGRPFTMGEDTTGGILFPPTPSVFYGALRGLIAMHNGITDGKTANTETQNIKINAVDIWAGDPEVGNADIGNFYPVYAMPLDIIAFKGDKKTEGLQLVSKNGLSSSIFKTHQLQASAAKKVQDIDGFLLASTSLEAYINDAETGFALVGKDLIALKNHTNTEAKIGIGRNRVTSTVASGKLYRAAMLRMESVDKNKEIKVWTNKQLCFSVSFTLPEHLTAPGDGFMKIGGEAKMSKFSIATESPFRIPTPVFENHEHFFKLYLATPAIFENGALPDLFGDIAEIVACCTGKPQYIGGFDMAENKPKTMQRAVPAGSVYYFKLKNTANAAEQINALVATYHDACISDYRAKEGFGRAFFAKANTLFLNI